jgi:hypothetical protein
MITQQKKSAVLIQKFLKLVQQDVQAQGGIARSSIGQYNDTKKLLGLFTPETEEAKQVLASSISSFRN